MNDYPQAVYDFYCRQLPGGVLEKTVYTADCPFCGEKGYDGGRRLTVVISRDSFFHGYFRCLNRCIPGGFPLWFGHLAKIEPDEVPGFDPDREPLPLLEFGGRPINQEIRKFQDSMIETVLERFKEAGISGAVLRELGIGYNGRYIVYPYFQEDGNCYWARCVFPDRPEDYFWHGGDGPPGEGYQLFNSQDIRRCENGALIICEGEDDLLALKQLGLPGVAVPSSQVFEAIDTERLAYLRTIFIVTVNCAESEARARSLAGRVGYKARLVAWPAGQSRNYNLWQLARDRGREFNQAVTAMARNAKAFSPFSTPRREHDRFYAQLENQRSQAFSRLASGFARLDAAVGGMHGLNVIGGAPKVGKSCFLIQIGTSMALRGVPVIYYDFENGRQKIYQRTLARLSRLTDRQLVQGPEDEPGRLRLQQAGRDFQKLLNWFRVVNDRKVTPETMRRHIDFIRHETQSDYTLVVIDSLHKLPFKDFSERRTGIDAWLRQLESIRDELQVSFLVISELTRGDRGSYRDIPHMGLFKGSGDIEYSADNALVLSPDWEQLTGDAPTLRSNQLWLVASREHSPGMIATYQLDYPYWGFREQA